LHVVSRYASEFYGLTFKVPKTVKELTIPTTEGVTSQELEGIQTLYIPYESKYRDNSIINIFPSTLKTLYIRYENNEIEEWAQKNGVKVIIYEELEEMIYSL
jgi:hypothetical protein